MGFLIESWCFCKGVSKSEKMKAGIFTGKGQAMVRINMPGNAASGTGFLIHRNLLLTTHGTIPSVVVAENCEILLQNGLPATLFPHRFFITSSVLDLTIVGLDAVDGDSNGQALQYLKTCTKPNLDLSSAVYLLGYTDRQEFGIGEGKVIIATDNLIKLSTDGIVWSPGSAGFDVQGNLAFMICDPMKLATSPNTKSSTATSSWSSSWKKDFPMQFGMPMPVICDWLNQHWEGNLDDINKPKLPIIRMMSSGQKSDHSCTSFSMKQVFKTVQAENDGTPSSSNNVMSNPMDHQGQSSSAVAKVVVETLMDDTKASHIQGIPTPEIFESPKVTAAPLRKKDTTQVQLLDINFPPRIAKPTVAPPCSKPPSPVSDKNHVQKPLPENQLKVEQIKKRQSTLVLIDAEVAMTNSVNEAESEVLSSSSLIEVPEMHNEYSSEGETTMYSAETAESRNYTSPREGKFQQVGRSQSCVSYNRWDAAHSQRTPAARRAMLEKHRSYIHGRKMYSQGHPSHRSNDYNSPTVSSIMKKRTNSEQTQRPRPNVVHSSPRWVF